jgi:hypothetical protein
MSLLNVVRKKPRQEADSSPIECPHWELAPRWDSVSDMGQADRVTFYSCTSCSKTFTPEEARIR